MIQLHGLLATLPTMRMSRADHWFLPCGPLTALVSGLPGGMLGPKTTDEMMEQHYLSHHTILLAYCADHTVLPMRFGTVFSEPKAAQNIIALFERDYVSALGSLKNMRGYAVELALLPELTVPIAVPNACRNGRKRRSVRRCAISHQRRLFSEMFETRLAQFSPFDATPARAKPDTVLNTTVLVDPARLSELMVFAHRQEAAAHALGMSISVTGPWPAYAYAYAYAYDHTWHADHGGFP